MLSLRALRIRSSHPSNYSLIVAPPLLARVQNLSSLTVAGEARRIASAVQG
jgi:hypothetical protein